MYPTLRPAYTRQLLQRLHQGACIAVTGSTGQGLDRLVEDLVALSDASYPLVFPGKIAPEHLDRDLAAAIDGLCGLAEPVTNHDRIAAIFSYPQPCSFVLWVPGLASLSARSRELVLALATHRSMGLLLICEQRREAEVLATYLAFDSQPLPPLTYRRLLEETQRRLPDVPDAHEPVALAAFAHPAPLPLLMHLAGHWTPGQPATDQIDRLRAAFDPAAAQPAQQRPGFWQRLAQRLGAG